MLRGRLTDPTYRPQFSGHETFPLRQLWLRKAYTVVKGHGRIAPRSIFLDPTAIATFGVGKNMVSAIRHWALACDIIHEKNDGYAVTKLGELLFGKNGLDPYMEHPATAWLVHWHLAGEARRATTWYWLFNHVAAQSFDRDHLVSALEAYCAEAKVAKSSAATIRRDVECCIRSYSVRGPSGVVEDLTEPVLGDLGLLTQTRGGSFEFRYGPKPMLPDGIFLFALARFWNSHAETTNTLNLDAATYEVGSPGMVFKLDIDSVAERLVDIERLSGGAFDWVETAGLKQVVRKQPDVNEFSFVSMAYTHGYRRGH